MGFSFRDRLLVRYPIVTTCSGHHTTTLVDQLFTLSYLAIALQSTLIQPKLFYNNQPPALAKQPTTRKHYITLLGLFNYKSCLQCWSTDVSQMDLQCSGDPVLVVKIIKLQLSPFEHAKSIPKWPKGSVYLGNKIDYLVFLAVTFPKGLEVDLKGSNTFLSLQY